MSPWTPLVPNPALKVGQKVIVREETATGADVCHRHGVISGTSLVNFESHVSPMYSVLIPGERYAHDYFEWQLEAVIEHA